MISRICIFCYYCYRENIECDQMEFRRETSELQKIENGSEEKKWRKQRNEEEKKWRDQRGGEQRSEEVEQ